MKLFQVSLKCVTTLGLLVVLVRHGWALLAQDLLGRLPFLAKDFQQVAFITDSSLKYKAVAFPSNNPFGSLFHVEVYCERKASVMDIFHHFDQDMRTVVLIAVQNVTNLTEMLDELLNTLATKGRRSASGPWEGSHWNPMYFFFWPSSNDSKLKSASSASTKMSREGEFMSYLKRFSCHIPLNAEVMWIRESEEKNSNTVATDGTVIWESYSIKDKCFVQTIDLKLEDSNFVWKLRKYKWERRGNFNGALVIATAVIDPIYSEEASFKRNADGTVQLDHGMAVNIFRTFRHHLNFTEGARIGAYMLETPSPISSRATYEGMEIQLESGSADISITENAMTYDKAEVVQFLHSTTANWLEARFSQPPNSKWKFFFSPFSTSVWTATVIYLVAMIVCIGLYRWMGKRDETIEMEWERVYSYLSSCQLDFLWALGTLCQQGWYEWPRQTPVKLLFLVASTTGFLLFAAYSGTITSKLSVQDQNTVTFEKLLNKSYSFYMENDFDFPVDVSQRPQIRVHTIYTLDDARAAVFNISIKKSAFISYPEFFYAATRYSNFTAAETCSSFKAIRTSSTPNLCAMAVRKLSPFKEIFNVKTLCMWERGILRRIVKDYMATTQLRCTMDSHSLTPQTLSELFIAYASLGLGMTVATSLLLVEISAKLIQTFFWNRGSLNLRK